MKLKTPFLAFSLFASTSLINYSCIDHDYDLTKNIDLTISIGGNEFAIPAGKTEEIALSKMLKVEEGETVKIDSVSGDYYLLQQGEPSKSEVTVEDFNLASPTIEPIYETLNFKRSENSFGEATFDPTVLPEIKSTFEITANLPKEVKSLSYIEVDIELAFNFKYQSSQIQQLLAQELNIILPSYIVSSDLTNQTKKITNTIIRNNEPYSTTISIQGIKIDSNNLTTNADGTLSLQLNIDANYTGTFSVEECNATSDLYVSANMEINTTVNKLNALAVTGIIKPDIEIANNRFELNNLPDYLTNQDVRLDLVNPMVLIDINNGTPISADINGNFTSIYTNDTYTVTVPFAIPDIKANLAQAYCLSPINPNLANNIWIETPELPTLITRIPNYIDVEANAVASNNPSTIELGKKYVIETNYRICAPFAYGENMNIVYTDTIKGWQEDLKKYDVAQINATGYAINKIPLNLNITATAVRVNSLGELETLQGIDVTVTIDNVVDGTIEAGDIQSGSKSAFLIELKQVVPGSIKQLDGLIINAYCNSTDVKNGYLNAHQTFQLTDVKLKAPGGLIIDLNQ